MGTGGNDVLIGGDGIDDIASGGATWHQAMLILMGTAKWTPSLLRSPEHDINNKDIFNDDETV